MTEVVSVPCCVRACVQHARSMRVACVSRAKMYRAFLWLYFSLLGGRVHTVFSTGGGKGAGDETSSGPRRFWRAEVPDGMGWS